ncbi:unknown [Clostridium sp. CAG:793]|nr:unknown [Clostridium sp. CAG:793]
MVETNEKACNEVLVLLKMLPEAELKKIPETEIKFLEEHRDVNYNFSVNPEVPINEVNISKKAKAILVVLWKKYFATDIQKQKLDKILQENSMKEEQKKQEEYQYSDMFKNNTQKIINLPTVIEEKWYEKVWNKIKDAIFNIFHR